jgi:hypothetical protein
MSDRILQEGLAGCRMRARKDAQHHRAAERRRRTFALHPVDQRVFSLGQTFRLAGQGDARLVEVAAQSLEP